MTAAARKLAPRPSSLAVFIARAEARALLWQAGEFDLHEAVDELQAAAVRDGLVAELGQDAVVEIIAQAFAPVRDEHYGGAENGPTCAIADPLVVGLKVCADTKHHLSKWERRKAQAAAADETQARKPLGATIATLKAAEYLVQQGDAERFRNWLDRHSADERATVRKHLEAKR